jgi:hypothetical protein
MVWNTTFLDNVTSAPDIIIGTNNMVSGYYAIWIIVSIWFIQMIITTIKNPQDILNNFIAANAISLFFTFLLWIFTTTKWKVILIPLILLLLSLGIKKFSEHT